LACLVPRGGQDLYDSDLPAPLILAVGAEGPGLDPRITERADLHLTIPLAPPVESLYATVATAVALFEIARRGRARAR
jgi:23S rRNA (guanosine2251-2'-O)-methyltransferase